MVLLYGSDAEYALGALLVASSLRRVGARARRLLLHTADVPQARLSLMHDFYDEVRLIRHPVSIPHNSPLCVCARDFAHPQFLKLHLLELEFDKVLYLDCDVLVRRNLDDIFALKSPAAMDRILAMPPHGAHLPNRVTYAGHRIRGIQGGVMLLAPDKDRFASMRFEVEHPHALKDWAYRSSIGNEQDYLTWRYCAGLLEEEGHQSVWTHLGCEYNYEVHSASMYFAVGRERWLWLDYEREAAVLHFSAPFRKRAKCLLHDGGALSMRQQHTGLPQEDPRVAFAHRVWDAEVEQLREVIAAAGGDLAAWLGKGAGAHAAAFAVLDRSTGGMELAQLADRAEPPPSAHLVFEAFSSNCEAGLTFFPPAFVPGPPWGACFWARYADVEAVEGATVGEDLSEESYTGHSNRDGDAQSGCDVLGSRNSEGLSEGIAPDCSSDGSTEGPRGNEEGRSGGCQGAGGSNGFVGCGFDRKAKTCSIGFKMEASNCIDETCDRSSPSSSVCGTGSSSRMKGGRAKRDNGISTTGTSTNIAIIDGSSGCGRSGSSGDSNSSDTVVNGTSIACLPWLTGATYVDVAADINCISNTKSNNDHSNVPGRSATNFGKAKDGVTRIMDGVSSIFEAGEEDRRVHPNDPTGQAYTHAEFMEFARECSMQTWYAEHLWREAGGGTTRCDTVAVCTCAEEHTPMVVLPQSEQRNIDEAEHVGRHEDVGAWLHLGGSQYGSAGQWCFGFLSKPPHCSDCPVWRQVTAFHVKILRHGFEGAHD